MPPVLPAAPRSTPESSADNATVSCPLVNLPPKLITQILLLLKISDILRVRQTCKHLFKQTKSQKLWARIAPQLLHSPEIIWPSWALPLHAIPAETIEDLVFRTGRLAAMQRTFWIDDSDKEIRTSFEGLILRPYDSPMWLHLIRGRWLLVQLNDFTLELWDLDDTAYANPAATCTQLGGFVDGIVHAESGGNIEIVISTTSFQMYKFAPILPFKHDPRPGRPNLTVLNSIEGYSSLKARAGQLLAFGASSGNNLRTCIVDESTGNEVELSLGPDVKEVPAQKTLDILIQGDVIFVARHRNLQLYATSDVEQALADHNLTSHSIRPFQSLTYPSTPLLHNPKFHPIVPSYMNAPPRSIAITHFVDQYWHAFIVQPKGRQADSLQRNYEVLNLYALSRCMDPIYGTSVGENGYRSAILAPQGLSIHLAKLWENESDDIHMPVLWRIPDAEVDLPRPGCIAFDEATGICVAGMGSGRLWIGDAVTGREPKLPNIPDIQKSKPHPDPRWPELPSFYFWDKVYKGPLSESDPREEIVPGWSTAVDHYIPWRNRPETYGGIQWFVENVMGLSGPARTLLFSTELLSQKDIDGSAEFIDVDGTMFLVKNFRELCEVKRLVDGTTLADVIGCLKRGGFNELLVCNEQSVSDYTALAQHLIWYNPLV